MFAAGLFTSIAVAIYIYIYMHSSFIEHHILGTRPKGRQRRHSRSFLLDSTKHRLGSAKSNRVSLARVVQRGFAAPSTSILWCLYPQGKSGEGCDCRGQMMSMVLFFVFACSIQGEYPTRRIDMTIFSLPTNFPSSPRCLGVSPPVNAAHRRVGKSRDLWPSRTTSAIRALGGRVEAVCFVETVGAAASASTAAVAARASIVGTGWRGYGFFT